VGGALASGCTQGVHRRSRERGELLDSLRIVVGEVQPAFLVRQLQQPVAAALCPHTDVASQPRSGGWSGA
jgi:hypothetical protein